MHAPLELVIRVLAVPEPDAQGRGRLLAGQQVAADDHAEGVHQGNGCLADARRRNRAGQILADVVPVMEPLARRDRARVPPDEGRRRDALPALRALTRRAGAFTRTGACVMTVGVGLRPEPTDAFQQPLPLPGPLVEAVLLGVPEQRGEAGAVLPPQLDAAPRGGAILRRLVLVLRLLLLRPPDPGFQALKAGAGSLVRCRADLEPSIRTSARAGTGKRGPSLMFALEDETVLFLYCWTLNEMQIPRDRSKRRRSAGMHR
jgi:hypothetical protein